MLHKKSTLVELRLDGVRVVLEVHVELANLTLVPGSNEVVNFDDDEKGCEVHRLINDALVLISFSRENDHTSD